MSRCARGSSGCASGRPRDGAQSGSAPTHGSADRAHRVRGAASPPSTRSARRSRCPRIGTPDTQSTSPSQSPEARGRSRESRSRTCRRRGLRRGRGPPRPGSPRMRRGRDGLDPEANLLEARESRSLRSRFSASGIGLGCHVELRRPSEHNARHDPREIVDGKLQVPEEAPTISSIVRSLSRSRCSGSSSPAGAASRSG